MDATDNDLRTYLDQAERGAAARIARALGVHPVMVSQWANGVKAVSRKQAPALEVATEFKVRCERTCPKERWVRVPDPAWPNGKPFADETPGPTECEEPSDRRTAADPRRATDPRRSEDREPQPAQG